MIACISPSAAYSEETLSTLKYATRTMNIKNKPIIQVFIYLIKYQIFINLKFINLINLIDGGQRSGYLQFAAREKASEDGKPISTRANPTVLKKYI